MALPMAVRMWRISGSRELCRITRCACTMARSGTLGARFELLLLPLSFADKAVRTYHLLSVGGQPLMHVQRIARGRIRNGPAEIAARVGLIRRKSPNRNIPT